MSRKAHQLKPNHRCVVPEHIMFVDTETTQTINDNDKIYQNLKLGVAIYYRYRRDDKSSSEVTCRFRTKEEFWQFVSSYSYNKTVLYLISHNATFDFIVLEHIKYLSKQGYNCQFIYEGGVTFISKWHKAKHTIVILDNSNWFAGKLNKWSKELSLDKLTMPTSTDSEDKWFVYCERDTRILLELFKWYVNFIESNDLGNFQYTIASSAFSAYRHRFMTHKIYIPDDKQEQELARESYHGGRTECFRIGEFNDVRLYKVDINSMYPYVMAFYQYPTCFDGYYERPNIESVKKSLLHHAIIANVLVSTSLPYYVYRQNDRNIYPIGTFRTVLTTEELKIGFEYDWIKEVYSCTVYRKRAIFKEYVNFFYTLKNNATIQGQTLLRSFAKLYLNSLYGKFGQRGYVDRVIGETENVALQVYHGYHVQSDKRYTLRQIGKDILYSERGKESYNSFCAIASHVTANARIYLYDTILRAGVRHCLYCDTDSIIVDEVGYSNLSSLLDDTRIGWLKTEGTSDKTVIVAPKHYFFDNHWTMKGIRDNATHISELTYKQEVWPGFNSILKSGEEQYYNIFQTKTLSPKICSGTVQKDGYVTPFVI